MSPACSIVVADPEPARGETKCSLLRDAGWTVTSAQTAAKTHGHVEKGGIALLILDTGISCGDGLDLCRKIKDAYPTVLVLHTTSETYESCADGYLREPIDSAVLVAACRSLLRLRDAHADLERRTAHLNLAQEAAGMAVVDWDLTNDHAVWSAKLNEMLAISSPETEGPVPMDALMSRVHPDDRERIASALVQLRRDGGRFDDDFRATCGDGRLRWIGVRGQIVAESAWAPARLLGAVFENTARKHEEDANALLAAVVNSSGDAIVGMDTEGRLLSWNEGAQALFGYAAEEIIGQHGEVLVPNDRVAERADLLARLRAGESIECQTVRRRKNGRGIHVWLRASPIRSPKGQIVGFSGIYRDTTEVRHRQQHVHQLLRELAHRSKNLMAIIQSMARHSLSSTPSPEEFVEKFIDRLRSLSVSHDLLSNDDWRGAPVKELVRQQLGQHTEWFGERIQFEGPDLMLQPAAAQSIGMALHELSCNAHKHGALSGPGGSVRVRWRLKECEDGVERFEMEWVEHDGPTVLSPVRQGFGHTVIGRITGQALGGVSTVEFPGDGIRWTLEAPSGTVIRTSGWVEDGAGDPGQATNAPVSHG